MKVEGKDFPQSINSFKCHKRVQFPYKSRGICKETTVDFSLKMSIKTHLHILLLPQISLTLGARRNKTLLSS